MELIDTRIGSQSDGVTTVEFIGQGGESITVKMAAGAVLLDRQAALLRARQMMVQLTAFDTDERTSATEGEGSHREAVDNSPTPAAGDRPSLHAVADPVRR